MAEKRDFQLLAGGKGKKRKQGRPHPARHRVGRAVLLVAVSLAVVAACFFVLGHFQVKTITVEGNAHYTDQEIIDMVLSDKLSYNSIFLSVRYHNRQIKDVPFIQTMSVEVVSPDTIRIMVYEKSVAGYVDYLGRYMYFDRDGIVVESSATRTQGIPQVTGIAFDRMALYEPLPVEDAGIFQEILDITQLLDKYHMVTDKIHFNESSEITLYFGQIRARLGRDSLEEKIMRLQDILPHLEGKSGVLPMENYSGEGENITFVSD